MEQKMNIEICKKCLNYPDWYELVSQNRFELVFQGCKKMGKSENFRVLNKCMVKHIGRSGTDYSYMISRLRPEFLLSKPRIRLMKEFCPCYAEHEMSKWNEK